MSLDPSYLEYPKRRRGMDHDYYPYSNFFERKPLQWFNAKKLLIWPVISLEYFPMVPSDDPFRAPGHMQTAYPDYRHYTAREYGTRIGIYRLLGAFEKVGAKISVATNSVIAERYPELIADILSGGHEIIAHSTDMNGTIAGGMDEADEKTFQTQAGPISNLPLNHELSDRQIINVQQQSVDSYAQQMTDAADWLLGEADKFGGRMLPMHLTPYIMGLPYRISAFEKLIADFADRPDIGFARGDTIIDSWSGQ